MTQNPDVDGELLVRLGKLVTVFAFLEATINEYISFFVRADPGLMYVVTQSVAASTQLGWLRTLVEIRVEDEGTRSTILDLLDSLKLLQAERNALVHGLWMPNDDGSALVQTIKLDRREMSKCAPITRSDLDHLIDEITDTASEFSRIGKIIGVIR